MKPAYILSVPAVSASALLLPAAARACAVCLTGAGSADAAADGFNFSLLFLMAMPYAVVGSIAGWLFYAHWRVSAKRQAKRRGSQFLRLAWMQKESTR